MSAIARFRRGAGRIEFEDGTAYSLMADFVPPGTALVPGLSDGTAANEYGGSEKFGERATSRSLTFSVNCHATTTNNAVPRALARKLIQFLLDSRSPDPLYFEFTLTPALPEPFWGQLGGWYRVEVIQANAGIVDDFGEYAFNENLRVVISLTVSPAAEGIYQKLPASTGGNYHERLGLKSGGIRGLRVCEATTNKMTNPCFAQYGADSNWSAGSALDREYNYTYRYQDSIKSYDIASSSASNNTYTQSIAAGNTNKHSFSAIVRRQDGAAVTSNDLQIYYGSAQATTFQALGDDGLYLAYADNITGVSAATATGIVVKAGARITLLAYQMEEKTYHTPIAYGDMPGCSWAGTRNDSTSTRIVAFNRNDFQWGPVGGFLIVWQPDYPSTASGNRYLFDTAFYFNATDDKFYLTDGTNTISSAAQTFAAGDTLRLMCTFNTATGLKIYLNGTEIATGASYDGMTAGVNYVGHNNASSHAGGIFLGFDFWKIDLTSYVTAIDAAAANIIAQTGLLETIPMLWTATGSSRSIINHTDSATHQNYFIVDGIPGDQPARTQWRLTPSQATKAAYMLIHTDAEEFHKVDLPQYYVDEQGTADANASGGEYKSKAVTILENDVVTDLTTVSPKEFFERKVLFFVRLKDSAASRAVQLYPWFSLGAGNRTFLPGRTVTIDTSWRWFYAGSGIVSKPEGFENLTLTMGLAVGGSGSFTVHVDFYMAVPGQAAIIRPRQGDIGSGNSLWVQDKSAHAVSASAIYDTATLFGSAINLIPGRSNIIFGVTADDGEAHVITDTIVVLGYFAPRWSLL
jgi:hypothetical protein